MAELAAVQSIDQQYDLICSFKDQDVAAFLIDRVKSVRKNFFEMGYVFNLFRMRRYGSFDGYESIYAFAEDRLGLKKTTVKNLMALNAEYSVRKGVLRFYWTGSKKIMFSQEIAPEWENYTQTALVEMLSLSEVERTFISPDMTIAQIRQYKKKDFSEGGQSTDREALQDIVIEITAEEQLPDPIVIEAIKEESAMPSLKFKNDMEREKWLDDYTKHCYLWIDVPLLGAKFYRYNFKNDVYLLITEADNHLNYQLFSESSYDYLILRHWRYSTVTKNQVIDWLKHNRTEL